MVNNQIYPSSLEYLNSISQTAINLKSLKIDNEYIMDDIKYLNDLLAKMKNSCMELQKYVVIAKAEKNFYKKARYIKENILGELKLLRLCVDIAEIKIDKKYWPMPTYEDLLFSL